MQFNQIVFFTSWADPEIRQGGLTTLFFSSFIHQRIIQGVVRTSLEKQLDPRGPIASRGWSVPVVFSKPIATCSF